MGDMSEDNHPHSLSLHPASCEQDLNSNCATTTPQETTTVITASRLSNVSSNDAADHHDRPDHQRLADYGGYKEQNGTTPSTTTTTPCTNSNRRHPPSIFAFLNSPNLQGDFTYEDLSRNIDANLAEIDMEDFRSEDINSILALPAMYCGDFRSQNHGEQAASLSCSIMAKFDAFDSSSITHYSTSGESTDMSVCKSEPLFSPVKETMPFPAFSIDSLDCDSYNEQELMLTCQANMNNYTIAFEGSMTKYSDDSDYHEANGSETTESDSWSGGNFKLRSSDSIDGSLVQSDFGYTTWSKLKRVNDVIPQKFPQVQNPTCKSQSLPNLFRKSDIASDIKISQLNVSTDSDQCVPVYDVQSSHSTHFSQSSASSSQQSLSLMRLFMQQKNAGTGSSASSSIIHSLSSGTLQQMEVTYSNATSTDERLQQVLSARLNESDCSVSDFYDGDSSKDDIPHWRQKSVGAKESIGSPSHLLHAMKNVGDTTAKTTLKRRLRSSSGTCKMFGGEAMHEDSTGRAISPMASPIEEEDEDDEMMGGWIDSVENGRSSETDDMDSEPTMVCKSTKNDVWRDIMSRRHKIDNLTIANNLKATLRLNSEFNKNNVKHDGIGSKADNSSTSANLSQGTQTKCFSNNNNNNNYYYKFPSQTDTTFNKISLTTSPPALSTFKGQDYFSPKKRLNGTGEATCSSSSGYTSIRSTSTEQMQRTSPMSGAQHDDLKKGSCKHNVTITEFKTCSTQIPVHVHDEAIQTSFQGEWLQRILASCARIRLADRMVQTDVGRRLEEKVQHSHRCPEKKSIYVCYPNYSLPDLGFLRECGVKSEAFSKALLLPVNNLATSCPLKKYAPRPQSCTALESLRQIDLNRIQDWDSLNVLLPQDVQKMLAELRSKKVSEAKEPGKDNTREIASDDGLEHHDTGPNSPSPLTSQSPSSTKKDGLHHMYVYQYDSYEIEDTERGPQVRIPPPLPKRSISLPQGDCQNIGSAIPEQYVATKPPLPKGILRRSGALTTGRKSPAVKRYSMPDFLILQQQQENVHNSRQRMQSCNYPCSCTLSNGGLTNLLNLGQKPYALSDDCKPLGPTSGLPKAQLDTEGMSRCSPNHAVADIDNVDKDILSSCPLCTKTSSPKDDDVVEGILNIQRQRSLLEHYENHGQHQELNQDCTSDACCHEQESKNKKTVSFSSNVQTGDQEWHQDKQEERGSLNPRDDEAAPIQCQCLRGNGRKIDI